MSQMDSFQYDDDFQYSSTEIDLQTAHENSQIDTKSWRELLGDQQNFSQPFDASDFSFDFPSQDPNQTSIFPEELDPNIDYETIIRSHNLYYDPDPEIQRRPNNQTSLVYTQNVMVKYLQPPPIPQGPLIIREIRPPAPPAPPPLIIRQRAQPPPELPPLILRERPPPMPSNAGQTITKVLPPLPAPPRSLIIEKLPPLPPKPRDIIIERWIPYEAIQKRKVIVERAEQAQTYRPPRNIIIVYEPVEPKIIRKVERLAVRTEDPIKYFSNYQNSLLDKQQMLNQIVQLGIFEDLSPPATYSSLTEDEQLIGENISSTYDNILDSEKSSFDDDLSNQLAQYGLTKDSIAF